ncbi:MAG: bifunctional demethylmenaquinone methyltransferase/2-methoxy-6-polyprenyl-1,4-benzoquinol methylase UbiE [Bacteroides sp.]|nr:bifunctional demethylmenaquinone methyltransferase/2-methoxy-6-polyprenyl-1,4-benzoquinol methylase UbiE [Bacteroides sp.]
MADYPQQRIKPYGEEGAKGEQVERMFDNIAPAYDRLNHTLSLGIDRYWRKRAIAALQPLKPRTMMDVATGTGDFALLAYNRLAPGELIGTDISEGMMDVARAKAKQAGLGERLTFVREDCMALSFPDSRFDAVTVAFGVRNFEDLDRGLAEMCRVLRPGGQLVILELTSPERFPMRQLFGFYGRVIIPLVGKLLSKDSSAYRYLPHTMAVFPQGEQMQGILYRAGFKEVRFERLTFGICTLYVATK